VTAVPCRKSWRLLCLAVLAPWFVGAGSPPCRAAVTALEVTQRSDVFGGRSFGDAGPYEKIVGRLRYAVDPASAANRAVVDLDLAPRDPSGRVEFSADVYILRPKSGGMHTALLEVGNRGNKALLPFFDRASGSSDPVREADFGDGWLLDQGYTLVWVGWQFDVPRDPTLLRLYPPRPRSADGTPIEGPVRVDFVAGERLDTIPLGDRNHIPYPVHDPDGPGHVLTVRDGRFGPRTEIPRERWRFESGPRPAVRLEGGLEPGRIYELVYRATDPVVVGAGLLAVRDAAAWLKHEAPEDLRVARAYGFGISQSGRFLRHFVYQGFNADERARRVFDALLVHVAGAGRGSFNHRFAQASRDAQPFSSFFYPTDLFPFTDAPEADPETGVRDGLDARYRDPGMLPRTFYTNTSFEYYGRAASLIHTSPDGGADVALPPHVRAYLLAGGMHFPGPFPTAFAPAKDFLGRHPLNPNDYRWAMCALLADLDEWARLDRSPPPSRHPAVSRGTLVSPDKTGFPVIPGVTVPNRVHAAYRVDYGPRFDRGIVDLEPPRVGAAYATRVPKCDADGNDVDGIRMPDIAVPLATYTGWNLRDPSIGAPDELANYSGSFIPFPRTRAAREASSDPRPSIAERYANRDDYLTHYREAVDRLVADRFLLARDRAASMARGRAVWDWATGD
jgi:Alpha/beta hydrolase domain